MAKNTKSESKNSGGGAYPDGLLDYLWYIIAGVIVGIPVFFSQNPKIVPELKGGDGVILGIAFAIGYVVHTIFRWLTFEHYFSTRPAVSYLKQTLDNKVSKKVDKKLYEKLDLKIIDAIYNYYFYSNDEKFGDKFAYIKRKSRFAVSCGVITLALFIGASILMFSLIVKVSNNLCSLFTVFSIDIFWVFSALFNVCSILSTVFLIPIFWVFATCNVAVWLLSNTIFLWFVAYFTLWLLFRDFYQKLDKNMNLHEVVLISLNKKVANKVEIKLLLRDLYGEGDYKKELRKQLEIEKENQNWLKLGIRCHEKNRLIN